MFGTVIIDAYRKEEALEMADAIDDLCSPTDNYGWASAGIYCFWDYYAEAVLYIGLTESLSELVVSAFIRLCRPIIIRQVKRRIL